MEKKNVTISEVKDALQVLSGSVREVSVIETLKSLNAFYRGFTELSLICQAQDVGIDDEAFAGVTTFGKMLSTIENAVELDYERKTIGNGK